ncbi:MAG: AAA family ATPase [Sulfuricellaceae bacterium]
MMGKPCATYIADVVTAQPGRFYMPDRSLQTTCAASVDSKNTLWLLPGWLPIGELAVLAGAPGNGKGQITAAIAARMSKGYDHPSWPGEKSPGWCKVIIWSSEDDFQRVIRPRLEASGARLEYIINIDGIKRFGPARQFSFANDEDVSSLIEFAEQEKDVGLIIIDPASLAVDGDFSNNTKVGEAFIKLGTIAKRLDCAILVVTHDVKNAKGKSPLSRVAGPRAVTGVPRSVMLVTKIMDGSSGCGGTHILVRAKSSLDEPGQGYEFCFHGVEVSGQDHPIKTSRVVFGRYHPESAEEILAWAESAKAEDKLSSLDAAINFLKNTLRSGSQPYPEIKKLADAAGISKATLDRAKKHLCISTKKQEGAGQFSPFVWSLPHDEQDNP